MTPPLIDSHCHLISYKYDESEISDIIQRAQAVGVNRMITLGTDPEDWDRHLSLTEKYPHAVYACLGIHPGDVHSHPLEESLALLEQKASHHPILAIGETGLDYFHPAPEGWETPAFRKLQQQSLEAHFALAEKLNLNIVIHTRDKSGIQSFEDTLAIARPYAGKVRTCFHCFIGDQNQAKKVLDLNGILSFTGISTFSSAKDVLAVAKSCPPATFCIETDSPYLAPTPHRGQRNEPAYVEIIAQFIAQARQESIESFAQHTTSTAEQFFGL